MGTVAERIKTIRNGIGMSQAEFAQILRVTRGHVSKLEIGQATPSEQLLALISKAFGVEWQWLSTGKGKMFTPPLKSDEFERQKLLYLMLRERLHTFLMNYDWMAPWVAEGLKEAHNLDPALCPSDLRPLLLRMAQIPESNLFQLVRAKLVDLDIGDCPEE